MLDNIGDGLKHMGTNLKDMKKGIEGINVKELSWKDILKSKNNISPIAEDTDEPTESTKISNS